MKNILLFTHGKMYEDIVEKGDVTALFIPVYSKYRRFGDLTNPNAGMVKERYGDRQDNTPLWRQDGPFVDVYGNIPEELEQRRNAISVYLPQDFAPAECRVFFYVINGRWVVHGMAKVNDDGKVTWGTSLIDGQQEGVEETIVNSVSELMLENYEPNQICIAVHQNAELTVKLDQILGDFELSIADFDKLNPSKEVIPIYRHRDFGLLMVTIAMLGFLFLVGVLGYWFLGYQELSKEKEQTQTLRQQLNKLRSEKKLSMVKDPNAVLRKIKISLPKPPSSFLHAVAEVGREFGGVQNISFKNTKVGKSARRTQTGRGKSSGGILEMKLGVIARTGALLAEQEQVAGSIMNNRPWIRYVERSPGGGGNLNLLVGVKIE